MIIYNGSVWHEHGPNVTDAPRRSIQGAFIRRIEKAALDWRSRMRPETLTLSGIGFSGTALVRSVARIKHQLTSYG